MAKVGANEPCPCGSGKKYKKCCRDIDEGKNRTGTPTPEQLASVNEVTRAAQLQIQQSTYRAPEYYEFELGGQKFRIVGRGVYGQPNSGQVGDVIIEHLKTQVLGKPWIEAERRKGEDAKHVVMRWLEAWED